MSASPERERRSFEVSSDFVPSAFARWGVRASARGGSGGGQAADLVLEGELALLYDHHLVLFFRAQGALPVEFAKASVEGFVFGAESIEREVFIATTKKSVLHHESLHEQYGCGVGQSEGRARRPCRVSFCDLEQCGPGEDRAATFRHKRLNFMGLHFDGQGRKRA